MSVQVSNLVKTYREQKAVNNVSFEIGKGEIVGFLGPNGAGKSTTMKIITGYLQPDNGTATVCGIDVQANPLKAKQHIGYLPEGNPLYHDMYIREYLSFTAITHGIAHPAQAVEQAIATVGLTAESNKKTGQLSKGYKQRVGLAAALIHNPDVFILDEPTTGLDPNQVLEIREVIKQLGKEKTVLFSSHILQEVEAVCDRIIIIDKGQLIADDSLSALRNTSRNHIIRVGFKEAIAIHLLQNLAGIIEVRQLNEQEWELSASNIQSVKKQLLELALQQNLNITSLQSGGQSLEDVFRNMTK